MNRKIIISFGAAVFVAAMALVAPVWAATGVQVGASGKTFASSAVQCAQNPYAFGPSVYLPVLDAGLLNPKAKASADVSLNGFFYAAVTADAPATKVWLDAESVHTVKVALSNKTADTYQFTVKTGMCGSLNTFSTDGALEYAASGKSYATVTPGCALNGATGQIQPYINLLDNGNYLLNVSVNDVPLTQLSATRPHTPVFLSAGLNVISAANGSLSTDYYVRDGGAGTCTLP